MKYSFLIFLILATFLCVAQTAHISASQKGPEEFHDPPEQWQVIPHASVAESNRPGFIVVGIGSIIDATHDLMEILFGRPYYGN